MMTLIHEFRLYPTVENARRLREYFEHNPSRVWVVRSQFLPLLAAAAVRGPSHFRS
jgi:hypothetical protein